MRVYDLRTEHLVNPLGIDSRKPRFSWLLESGERNVMQKAYRVVCTSGTECLWDSGRVESDVSACKYEGAELASAQQAEWTVTVWTEKESGSASAHFEMGLLKTSDWRAQWIEPEGDVDSEVMQPVPYIRKVFTVKEGLVRARIYQTAHGLYEFWINGKAGTGDKFKPGFTSYYHRLQYQTYDVAELLRTGENVWAVALGDGWWRGTCGGMNRNNFGYKLHFLGQLVLDYADGTQEIISTDTSFKTATGGLLFSDMKSGDLYDAASECEGWKTTDFDDSGWEHVHLAHNPYCDHRLLIPSRSVPVREHELFPARIFRDANQDLVLDFGQNIAGYVRMTLRGCDKGQEIELVHGEDIKNGAFSIENICMYMEGDRVQQINYIAKGEKEETYCPMFSVFGFRYVRVRGYEGNIREGDFTAIAVYSDMEETGAFSCSNELVNKLVSNSRWSQKDNFLDTPTDCPTRERSTWTGDGQVYCRTASEFMDVYTFYEKWMLDYKEEQLENGKILSTVPSTLTMQNEEELAKRKQHLIDIGADMQDPTNLSKIADMKNGGALDGSSGWADACVIIPYTMYLCYGDRKILENQYETAKKHVEYMAACAKKQNPKRLEEPQYHTFTYGAADAEYIWDTEFHYGEWLETDIGIEGEMSRFGERFENPDSEVPTAFMYYSTFLLGKMAEVLGKNEDAATYFQRSGRIKEMFNKYLIKADGSIKEGRQAPNVRALAFGLCSEENVSRVASKLNEYVISAGYHLNTGFLATPYILNVLADHGYIETAYRLLEQITSPSWLYSILKGATTILEEWTGMDTHVGSFNHYSYGAVCDFLFSRVCGIRPEFETPGYKSFVVQPMPGGTLEHAEAELKTIHGKICSAWKKEGGTITYTITVPANTKAAVRLPGQEEIAVGSGTYVYTIEA